MWCSAQIWGTFRGDVKLTNCIYIVPRARMRGILLPNKYMANCMFYLAHVLFLTQYTFSTSQRSFLVNRSQNTAARLVRALRIAVSLIRGRITVAPLRHLGVDPALIRGSAGIVIHRRTNLSARPLNKYIGSIDIVRYGIYWDRAHNFLHCCPRVLIVLKG
jgi:hypothetical protein